MQVMPPACLQVGNLQASKPGNCWNDVGDAAGMPAGWQLQASKPGNCWNDAGDASGMPAGWQCRHQRLRVAEMMRVMPPAFLQVGHQSLQIAAILRVMLQVGNLQASKR